MAGRFKAVVFDLDGTLLDTLDDLAGSMNRVLATAGLPVHATERYRYFVGDGVTKLTERVLPEDRRDADTVARFVAAMRADYGEHWADKTQPYEGVPAMLNGLTAAGLTLTVLSNKPDDFTKLCVAKLLPRWRFEIVRGVVPGGPVKPDPAGAVGISRELGVACGEFLYLGDTGTDMRTARGAGMYAVGALWGFREEEELIREGAAELAATPPDVLHLL
jgi:phosphoglycolate phosphatase